MKSCVGWGEGEEVCVFWESHRPSVGEGGRMEEGALLGERQGSGTVWTGNGKGSGKRFFLYLDMNGGVGVEIHGKDIAEGLLS